MEIAGTVSISPSRAAFQQRPASDLLGWLEKAARCVLLGMLYSDNYFSGLTTIRIPG
jgi:hypothetical protein